MPASRSRQARRRYRRTRAPTSQWRPSAAARPGRPGRGRSWAVAICWLDALGVLGPARRRGTRRSASARTGRVASRDSMNARPGSSRVSSCTSSASSPTSATSTIGARRCASSTTPLLAVGAEADRLAVAQRDQHVVAHLLAGDRLEGAVVEDVAVLVDLDERRALVVVGPPERLHHVLAVHVVGAGHERGLGAEARLTRVERRGRAMPNGVDLVTLPTSLVGEYWPLVSP